MSSRNKRLSKDERKLAPLLNEHMRKVADDIRAGNAPAKACLDAIDQLHALGAFKVEYLELRSADTLELVETYNGNARLFAAAWLGDVRLIDNIQV